MASVFIWSSWCSCLSSLYRKLNINEYMCTVDTCRPHPINVLLIILISLLKKLIIIFIHNIVVHYIIIGKTDIHVIVIERVILKYFSHVHVYNYIIQCSVYVHVCTLYVCTNYLSSSPLQLMDHHVSLSYNKNKKKC